MKHVVVILSLLILSLACSGPKSAGGNKSESEEKLDDKIEYDIKAFDSRFESWYQKYRDTETYQSQKYYEDWNRQYVSVWNIKATNAQKNSIFEPIVGYDPNMDFGLEFNHKLFYYFQYVENKLGIKVMPGGPKVVNN